MNIEGGEHISVRLQYVRKTTEVRVTPGVRVILEEIGWEVYCAVTKINTLQKPRRCFLVNRNIPLFDVCVNLYVCALVPKLGPGMIVWICHQLPRFGSGRVLSAPLRT
jgi:hypothetical protein